MAALAVNVLWVTRRRVELVSLTDFLQFGINDIHSKIVLCGFLDLREGMCRSAGKIG